MIKRMNKKNTHNPQNNMLKAMASKMLFTSNGNIIDSQNIRTTTTTFATQNKRLTDKP